MKSKFMTKINIDVEYYRANDFELTATFSVSPVLEKEMIKKNWEDEIHIEFQKVKRKVFDLTLTQEQAKEFIWALQKMIEIGDEYRA